MKGRIRGLPDLMMTLLTQPTAPFRESWVQRACLSYCAGEGLPVFEDEIGNLWIGVSSAAEAKRASLVFVAHLDHPGIVIEGFERRGRRITARGRWLGGGPMDIRNSEVKIFSDVNALMVFDGTVRSHTKGPRGPDRVLLDVRATPLAEAACTPRGFKALGPWGACLWYGKHGIPRGVARKNGLWLTKAADDLVGACALLEGLRRSGQPRGTAALLTRAEESGFHGALHILERGFLDPRRTLMISVETSSQLPGAVLGGGPVVRLGDRTTIFDPALVYWVQERAAELKKRRPAFRYQKRVMDGGTCEATAFNCFDFHVAGISTPLRNYHNMAKKGSKPAPEAVAATDVEHLAALIAHLMKSHRPSHSGRLRSVAFDVFTAKLMRNQRAHERYFNGS